MAIAAFMSNSAQCGRLKRNLNDLIRQTVETPFVESSAIDGGAVQQP
jgi:hypothetical protein